MVEVEGEDKKAPPVVADEKDVEVAPGYMQELEVDLGEALHEEGVFDVESDHSPYPEVRAVVPEVDDPNIPVNTLRMWVIGFVFTMLGSGINNFFSLRYPSVHIVSLVAELLAYPFGAFLAYVLPLYTVNLGPLGRWCINPDRHFNIKEHALITIMSNVSIGFGSADATGIIQAASAFYGFPNRAGFNILVVLCCQLLGFGVAGLSAPWLVTPANIIWPGTLAICALLSTLHSRANAVANGWKISRLRFFNYVMVAAFVWWWFPGLIFVALSYFTWVCWIAPHNRIVNHLFGMQTGLGLSPITFDWTQIAYNTNPLLSPAWAAQNVFWGFVGAFWIIVPAIYYTNTWWTGYLPLMTADVYDRTGSVYNTSLVLTDNQSFNETAYQEYSPPFLGAPFAFVYGLSFASITSVLVHVYLWHGTEIWTTLRGGQKFDIHARLMRAYKQTPWWWYAVITVLTVGLSIAMVEAYATLLPVYGVFLALVIPAVYMVPCGIIQGITNVDAQQLNVLSEFIGGYMFQGKPLANMIFKTLSQDVVQQGIFFAQDMKLGHYMKIAPRLVFAAQGSATVLGALTQVGVTSWMLGNIKDICDSDQSDGFTCPNGRTYFSSSVIWGLIGPARLYSAGKIYSGLLHFFWIGALMPLVTYMLWKYTKKDYWRFVNWPLIFVGTYNVPPATGINYSSWALVNWVFNHYVYRRFSQWWTKYNYILAAALDTGTALAGIIIFFCVSYPGGVFPDWWGNTVYANTDDANGVPYLDLPSAGYFGPANGTWA
ncbi:small oligopeptide transporter, OPT family [Saccharata proteae CBS 121410]|uniref:Small oligopeptide transporter, OPT family n=1 Tax=Saccharata proteae CBS 121410 TaxID=1314787 RepID=A0A9P4HZ24_9PEZI|nr:small oligopeptide transporter, OPT family [Saccharata proteae CBS 121410]